MFTDDAARELWKKVWRGDCLTDKELYDALVMLRAALPFIGAHPDFALARKEAIRIFNQLEGYYDARGLK